VAQYLKKNQRKKHQEVLLAHAVSTVQHGTHLLSYLFVLCTLLIPNPASSRKLQTKTTRNKNSSKAEPCLAGTVLGISHSERRAEWWHWCGRRPNKSIGFSWSISSLPSQARRAQRPTFSSPARVVEWNWILSPPAPFFPCFIHYG
jgi:hypothetical protein